MTEIGPTSNLNVYFEHVIGLSIGFFGTEGTFSQNDMGVGRSKISSGEAMVVAVVRDLVGCHIQGLVVFGYKDFGSRHYELMG